jgi:hypothetical protein
MRQYLPGMQRISKFASISLWQTVAGKGILKKSKG